MTKRHPDAPDAFVPPGRLMRVPAWVVTKAVLNALYVIGGDDTDQAEEVVRRVLAAAGLAGPEMPETPTDVLPDGTRLPDAPLPTDSLYQCGWGHLSAEGDVRMCVLGEADDEGVTVGHETPGEHVAGAESGDFRLTFAEKDKGVFYAPAWNAARP